MLIIMMIIFTKVIIIILIIIIIGCYTTMTLIFAQQERYAVRGASV